ncbi:ECF-type sigma factor [Dokdonella sp.]|uniref:ECF-type sigma factor n=1 Tax=Dokdonella sp. TaxID=2291710 RepID=UPI0025B8D13A|nr:ECF-type sigma factor [Dokdonella sp.]MBX3688883.1 sigma-70 family RNA polymerase sigma factor [Dokdonella sp.]
MNERSQDHEINRLIDGWRSGDESARQALVTRVYANVRAIAAQSLRAAPGATFNTTEVAHEALLRLLGADPNWVDHRHFFHVAAQATRQVLVEASRRRLADKRGGGCAHLELGAAIEVANEDDLQLVRIDEALQDLANTDPRRAKTVELVYFGGFSRAEVAAALDVSEGTVDRDLRLARAWLRSLIAT